MKIHRTALWLFAVNAWLASLASAPAASFTVSMNDFNFSPASLTIAQGDTVTWTNASGTSHTSTSGDPNTCAASALWNGDVVSGSSYTTNFAGFAPGTYPYICTLHCSLFGMKGSLTITSAANVPPSISLTNPIAGAGFRAPASIALMASVTNGSGTVTNVQFFSGVNPLGSVSSPPFNFTADNLAAGNYSFTAVAADDLGQTETSAAVNVFVLTNAVLSAPVFTNGQFQLTVQGIAGQTYATEASTNLTSWTAISTNVAPADIFDVLDPSATNFSLRFYRARQDF